jgi:hypothetical protein
MTTCYMHAHPPHAHPLHGYKGIVGGFYMDNFFIASDDTGEGELGHTECMHHLLGLMDQNKYYLRPAKCVWRQLEMDLLRLKVGARGMLSVDLAKMEGIKNWPRELKSKEEVCCTMGVLQYQRAFILGFSHIS